MFVYYVVFAEVPFSKRIRKLFGSDLDFDQSLVTFSPFRGQLFVATALVEKLTGLFLAKRSRKKQGTHISNSSEIPVLEI